MKTEAKISINGIDYSGRIGAVMKSLKYTEMLEGESDTCEIVMADNTHELLKSWRPAKGSEVKIEIVSEGAVYECGIFELDTLEYRSPPSEYILKMNSIAKGAQVKGVTKNRSWEQVNLSEIAGDIASGAGLSLEYETNADPEIKRAEQSGESDLSFLKRLCGDNGLNVRVHNKKVIVFEALKYEEKDIVGVISYGAINILKFNSRTTIDGIYKDAEVKYQSNNITEWLFNFFGGNDYFQSGSGLNLGGDNVLQINERVDSEGEAERLAKSRLREENKKEYTFNLTVAGNLSYKAGVTLELEEFGIYSGKYIVDRAEHSISNGYTTTLQMHKCLEGY